MQFQHTAARRRLGKSRAAVRVMNPFQHTAARRRLGKEGRLKQRGFKVSTHSRPKAAGGRSPRGRRAGNSFNTQPPEGGWDLILADRMCLILFQHTAARRRLGPNSGGQNVPDSVSTHSRPKAAGELQVSYRQITAGFNTQPPEGGW